MKILKTILDLIFPEKCLNCHKRDILICENCIKNLDLNEKELDNFVYSIFDYRNPIMKKIIWNLKYKNKKMLAGFLAIYLHERILEELTDLEVFENFTNPIIIPIPLSKTRLKERGYNQTLLIAEEIIKLDRENKFILEKNILYKRKETEHQARIKNRQERLKNIIDTFAISNQEKIQNKNIILIDDVVTTGATLKEARKILKQNGAKKIIAFTIAH